jgi:hypothetical protein
LELFAFGGNSADVLFVRTGNEMNWSRVPSAIPAASFVGGTWVGTDGRAYFIHGGTRAIWRSGRKKVHVPSVAQADGPYSPLRGFLSVGTPAMVSSHVLSGNSPWHTNIKSAY